MKKYISFILATSALLGVVSCNKLKDFGSTNVDPNQLTNPSTAAMLTNVEVGLAGYVTSAYGQHYCQMASEAEYPDISIYVIPQLNFAGNYSGNMHTLQTIIEKSDKPNEIAAARILKAYIFAWVTDAWGEIPYTDALKGTVPGYDKQRTVYEGILKELAAADAQFVVANPVTGDIMYGQDANKWKKLANSLRMIYSLRLSKRFPTASDYAATQFKAALATGLSIADNADNFQIPYPGGVYQNPYYATNVAQRDVGYSVPMGTIMSGFGDARIASYSSNTSSSEWVPYGWSENAINAWRGGRPTTWARLLAPSFRTETSPVMVINAAEVLLARAEAADRGWTTENAAALLAAGITQSYAQWNVGVPSVAYLTQTGVALSAAPGTGANLKQIATQRWIASFPDGMQGWAEWRRTGWPVLTPARDPASSSHTTIPRRFTYATNEYSLNPLGVATGVANTPGGDVQESRVWWDQ